jgi:predicted helicase
LSEAAAKQSAAESKDPAVQVPIRKTQGPSTRADTLARDDKSAFWQLVAAGKRLADLHVHYEQQPDYKLKKIWKQGAKLDYRVTKMRLSNKDKSILFYNDALTLKGIPLETYEYRLGNRSALDWVIDQYQLSTDKRSGRVPHICPPLADVGNA